VTIAVRIVCANGTGSIFAVTAIDNAQVGCRLWLQLMKVGIVGMLDRYQGLQASDPQDTATGESPASSAFLSR
jgi:hypothetical protein